MHTSITETATRWLEAILAERFGHVWCLSKSDQGMKLCLGGADGAILFDTSDSFTLAYPEHSLRILDAQRDMGSSPSSSSAGVVHMPSPLIEKNNGIMSFIMMFWG